MFYPDGLLLKEAKRHFFWKELFVLAWGSSVAASATVAWRIVGGNGSFSWHDQWLWYFGAAAASILPWILWQDYFSNSDDGYKDREIAISHLTRDHTVQEIRWKTFCLSLNVTFLNPLTWPLGIAIWIFMENLKAHDLRTGWIKPLVK